MPNPPTHKGRDVCCQVMSETEVLTTQERLLRTKLVIKKEGCKAYEEDLNSTDQLKW